MQLHAGSLKLAGLYLTILMAISLFFSGIVYQTSAGELDRGLHRPIPSLSQPISGGGIIPPDFREQLRTEREQQYTEAKSRIMRQLVITNILILLGGGLLSYYLALWTLRPIEEAHEAQSRFTADASHELRTPLTAMRTETEVSLLNPKLTLNDAKDQLRSNVEELEKLSALVQGLLRLAQLEDNHLGHDPIAVQDIVTRAAERVAAQASAKHIEVTAIGGKTAMVLGDSDSLTEALVTLLENAVKYSPDKTTVKIETDHERNHVSIRVIDKGIGIKPADLPHVFERFYRADSSRTKQQQSGYGLGLAIAQSVAQAHNGSLSVTSKLGKGSTFTLTLPASALVTATSLTS